MGSNYPVILPSFSDTHLLGMRNGFLLTRYFTVLTAAAFILTKGADIDMTELVKALIVCLLAGGAGAFATPE